MNEMNDGGPEDESRDAAPELESREAPRELSAASLADGRREDAQALLGEGMQRFSLQELEAAHALFERAHRRAGNDPRIMSWYGVTLVIVEKNSNLGMLYCDQALRLAGPSPDLLLNQARAYLALHQRERAYRAVHRGVTQWPDDPALRLAQDAMGWRRRPVLPCFGRASLLNRWLGKIRHRWHNYRTPPPVLSPTTLGLMPPPSGERREG
jgi:tetratricopeptide (TPR) repeat protein